MNGLYPIGGASICGKTQTKTNYMFYNKPILVIDFETSGLIKNAAHPKAQEPHELGAVLLSAETGEIIQEFHSEFRIEHPEFASPEAFKLSTITLEEVMMREKTLMEGINEFHEAFFVNGKIEDVRFASWNAFFDMTFLERAYITGNLFSKFQKADLHVIDIWCVYDTFRKALGKVDNLWGVKQALQELDLQDDANNFAHRGLDDCRSEAKILQYVYKALVPETVEA